MFKLNILVLNYVTWRDQSFLHRGEGSIDLTSLCKIKETELLTNSQQISTK